MFLIGGACGLAMLSVLWTALDRRVVKAQAGFCLADEEPRGRVARNQPEHTWIQRLSFHV